MKRKGVATKAELAIEFDNTHNPSIRTVEMVPATQKLVKSQVETTNEDVYKKLPWLSAKSKQSNLQPLIDGGIKHLECGKGKGKSLSLEALAPFPIRLGKQRRGNVDKNAIKWRHRCQVEIVIVTLIVELFRLIRLESKVPSINYW